MADLGIRENQWKTQGEKQIEFEAVMSSVRRRRFTRRMSSYVR